MSNCWASLAIRPAFSNEALPGNYKRDIKRPSPSILHVSILLIGTQRTTYILAIYNDKVNIYLISLCSWKRIHGFGCKTCVKRPLKNRQNKDLNNNL